MFTDKQITDNFVNLMKKILLKSPSRKLKFKTETGLRLPPNPIITRWGTWIQTVIYYSQNYEKIKNFVNQLNNDGVAAVSKVKKLLAENEKDLKCQIIFIEVNFSFLPTAIEKIQKRQPLADAFSVLHSVKEKVSIAEYKTKLDLSLAKNPDLAILEDYASVFSGETFEIGNQQPSDVLIFKNAPIVSAEIERCFSRLTATLTPQRQSMTMDNLRAHLCIGWNNYDDF